MQQHYYFQQVNAEVIDWQRCLSLSNHKAADALDLIVLLAEQLRIYNEKLHDAKQNKDLQQLREINHDILGITAYCGVPELQSCSKQLRVILHNEQQDELTHAIQNLQTAISNFMHCYEKLALDQK